jgi:hypothetical protein
MRTETRRTIYRVPLESEASGEGLRVVLEGHEVSVEISLEGRTRAITLDQAGALRMAASIVRVLGPSAFVAGGDRGRGTRGG